MADKRQALGWRSRHGFLVSVIVASLTYISSVTGALTQLRALVGWESPSDGMREADVAFGTLYQAQGGKATKRWAIDRLVITAQTHRELRPYIAERLADFVREQTVNNVVHDSLVAILPALEAMDHHDLEGMLGRRFPTPEVADYALRQLGAEPLASAPRKDDTRLNLRGIIIPQVRARGARFNSIDFSDAILIKGALTDAHFESCNLSGCVLSQSTLRRCVMDEHTSIDKARLVAVDAQGARLRASDRAKAMVLLR